LVICGFPSGSQFSVGRAFNESTWIIPASQIKGATVAPPRGFVGAMDVTITLVLANGSFADLRTLHLKWLPQTAPRRTDQTEVNGLLARGSALEAIGDLAGARLVLRRAAEAENARAAFLLAETYDPIVLEKLGEFGLASNVAVAGFWYKKARDSGSQEDAPGRLARIQNWMAFPKAIAATP
jgi:hypothetical protein